MLLRVAQDSVKEGKGRGLSEEEGRAGRWCELTHRAAPIRPEPNYYARGLRLHTSILPTYLKRFRYFVPRTSENPISRQLGNVDECTWTPLSRLLVPKVLPSEQTLEAQLSGAIAHDGVET